MRGRGLSVMVWMGVCGGVPGWTGAGEPPAAVHSVVRPRLLVVAHSRGGQIIDGAAARGAAARGAAAGRDGPRGAGIIVFDNFINAESTTGMNVSYLNLGSYTGADPSTQAIVLPMAERLRSAAPSDQGSGFLIPTDIVWNEYEADASRWPGGASGGPARLVSMSLAPSNYNIDPPVGWNNPVARVDTLRVRFFTSDRQVEVGGFDLVYQTPPHFAAYFGEEVDLTLLSPPLLIPRSGYVMLDWAEPNISGVGSMYAGGDFVAPGFPAPDSLRSVGLTDTLEMWWADGLIGAAGWPNRVDGAFDGDPGTTSYLDVFNTGLLANWNIALGNPPERQLCRDFPCRLVIEGDTACACDVNGSGEVNSQDFFDFIGLFFEGAADFNHSGFTDSQDFFDFLACFFAGC